MFLFLFDLVWFGIFVVVLFVCFHLQIIQQQLRKMGVHLAKS